MLAFSSSNRLCIHSASRFAGHRDSLWIFGPSSHQHFVVFRAISQKLLVRFTLNLIHNTLRGSDMPFSITVLWVTFGAEIWLLSHFFILHFVSGADLWNCWLDCSHMSYEKSQEGFSPVLNLTIYIFLTSICSTCIQGVSWCAYNLSTEVPICLVCIIWVLRSPFVLCVWSGYWGPHLSCVYDLNAEVPICIVCMIWELRSPFVLCVWSEYRGPFLSCVYDLSTEVPICLMCITGVPRSPFVLCVWSECRGPHLSYVYHLSTQVRICHVCMIWAPGSQFVMCVWSEYWGPHLSCVYDLNAEVPICLVSIIWVPRSPLVLCVWSEYWGPHLSCVYDLSTKVRG